MLTHTSHTTYTFMPLVQLILFEHLNVKHLHIQLQSMTSCLMNQPKHN